MTDAHNRTRYAKGCRCEICTRANTKYNQERRAAQREASATGVAVARPAVARTVVPSVPYKDSVTAAVKQELETCLGTESRPALAAMALALARVLDTPSALPQHAAAVGKLEALLTTIAKYGRTQETNLSRMRAELRVVADDSEKH